ncbi:LapA family protein [Pelistega europaea]|uniref:LapA family protein n=1 Tax=Pelistega europaea TaxID=106147 RepID=A0A7Y4L9R6_9BURK|nr:LapA family protein [Pelistega europaea]NOL49548.1 LapA family protein [Pelistega europaea]
MRYIVWALRLIIFILVVLFAIKNMEAVTVRFYGDTSLADIPLIVVILVSFALGAVYMYLLSLPTRFAKGRQISRLKGEVRHLQSDLQYAQKVQAEVRPESNAVAAPLDGFVATK